MPTPTAQEQLTLELINALRTDPGGEYARLTAPETFAELEGATDFFGVDLAALQAQLAAIGAVAPLAWNNNLADAASLHNDKMIEFDEQSHQLPGEPGLGDRVTAAGYTGWTALGENVFAFSSSAIYGHGGFVIDWGYDDEDFDADGNLFDDWQERGDGIQDPAGHRITLTSDSYTEIGIAITPETDPDTDVGELVTTHDLGNRNGYQAQFFGVIIDDLDNDDFYDIGEGLGGITITLTSALGSFQTESWSSGGWQIAVPADTYSIVFSGGALDGTVTRTATLGTQNVKLDIEADEATEEGETIVGSIGDDDLDGTGGDDFIRGLGGNDTIDGNGGDDRIFAGDGDDIANGNAGNDTINGGADTDTLDGGDGDDLILAAGANDVVSGGTGFDRMNGGSGNDTLSGGEGGDVIFGAVDDDSLLGEGGNDTINAGFGDDALEGGADSDRLYGSSGDDLVDGGSGADSLNGGSGSDTLIGGAGNDVLFGVGGEDSIDGGNGADTLVGGTGSDTLSGGAGNDNIFGKAGADRLTAGGGADLFAFGPDDTGATLADADSITDFSQAEGDTTDLRRIDADSGTGGDQGFAFIGTAAFSGSAGELRYEQTGGETLLTGDTDGDGVADIMIRLDGAVDLVGGDFLL